MPGLPSDFLESSTTLLIPTQTLQPNTDYEIVHEGNCDISIRRGAPKTKNTLVGLRMTEYTNQAKFRLNANIKDPEWTPSLLVFTLKIL